MLRTHSNSPFFASYKSYSNAPQFGSLTGFLSSIQNGVNDYAQLHKMNIQVEPDRFERQAQQASQKKHKLSLLRRVAKWAFIYYLFRHRKQIFKTGLGLMHGVWPGATAKTPA